MVLIPNIMETNSAPNTASATDFSLAQNQSAATPNPSTQSAQSAPGIKVVRDMNFGSSADKIEKKISDDVFSEEDKTPKEKISPILVLKNVSIFVWVLALVGFAWLSFDLHPTNKYLKHIGLVENTGKKHERLSTEQALLAEALNLKKKSIIKIETKIETQDFSDLEGSIASIKEGQVDWYDRRNGEVYVFGLKDMFVHIQDYFNSRHYQDPEKIISGRKDQVVIKDYSINRDGAQVTVQVSHVLGRVFFLANEFVEMVNAVPFLQDGMISSYSRQKNDIGDDTMEFSMNLKRQLQPGSTTSDFVIDSDAIDELEDLNDLRFEEFLAWFTEYEISNFQ
jgi:hypothetical protein